MLSWSFISREMEPIRVSHVIRLTRIQETELFLSSMSIK